MRMAQAGAVMINWFAVACELATGLAQRHGGARHAAGRPLARLPEPDDQLQRPDGEEVRSWSRRADDAEGVPEGGCRDGADGVFGQ